MHNKAHRFMGVVAVLVVMFGSYFSAGAKAEMGATGPLAAATTYYVSTSGNDANAGTSSAPFRTITRGISVLAAGDTLQVYGGTYNEQVTISKSGTSSAPITVMAVPGQHVIVDAALVYGRGFRLSGSHIVIEGFDVQRALEFCVDITGTNITVRNSSIHDCLRVGLRTKGQNVIVENSTIYNSALSDQGNLAPSGWSAALRVSLGSENVTIRNNSVFNNWGEGIAIGQAKNVRVLNNTVHDNFSQNIYINNSMDVNVEGNFVYSTNPTYYRNGQPANCIGLAEEFFEGWGAQLARIQVVNNIAAFCRRGIGYTYAEVAGGLDSSIIAFNTIWGSTEVGLVVIDQLTKTRNSVIANNIVQQPNGRLADIQVTGGVSLHHNFWVSPVSVLNNASGPGDRTGDVILAGAPGLDPLSYRLSATSPAIGGADPLGIGADFLGNPRGPLFDMGAVQYQGVAASVPASTATAISPTLTLTASLPPPTLTATLPPPSPTTPATVTASVATPSAGTIYDDKNAAFVYSAKWTDNAHTSAQDGSFKKSGPLGSTVSMTFTGSSFTIHYVANSTFGNMDVIVDGVRVGAIDQNSSTRKFQQTWSLPTALAAGAHTLLLQHTGPSETRITLDAITVFP